MCQGCVDKGYLAQATYDRIMAFNAQWPYAEFGPAHIVLSYCNVRDVNIDDSIAVIDAMLNDAVPPAGIDPLTIARLWDRYDDNAQAVIEFTATRAFLVELRTTPENERCNSSFSSLIPHR